MNYDVIVIGGGPAGLVASKGCAQLSKKTLLVEKHKIGGDCTNYGCIPSKTLISLSQKTKNWNLIREEIRKVQEQIRQTETKTALKKYGVETIIGEAKLKNKNTVVVNNQEYHAKKIILCTGARARTIDIQGIKNIKVYTNKTIFTIEKLPRRIAILGGGPIGCEIGQSLNRIGCETHIISNDILPRQDEQAREIIKEIFLKEGIKLHLNTTIKEIGKEIILTNNTKIKADALLLAIGRTPNTEGLEQAGIKLDDKNRIITDKYLRTNIKNIYAAGDCTNKYQFSHAAEDDARTIVTNLIIPYLKKREDIIPEVTYTTPQIASIGRIEGLCFRINFDENDRARTEQNTTGYIKLYTKKTGRVIGAQVIGAQAGELINQVAIAIKAKMSAKTLSQTVMAYPTRSQALKYAADKWLKEYVAKIFR